jgi:D-arabinose 1-dehydrogenase-like Zn-dependent alcohol dehydrogenase
MKAIVLRETGSADRLQVETLPDPAPGPGQVVVKVAQCGVCFHDVVVRNGTLRSGIQLPVILGHEVAGTVAALGRDVRGVQVGDRVASTQRSHVCGGCRYCRTGREPLCAEALLIGDRLLNGGYAEYAVFDADCLVPIPDGLDFRPASVAACAVGTAFHAVSGIGQVTPADTVLVTGASGGVGLHAVQIACASGATVLASSTSPDRAPALREAGARHVVLHGRGEDFSSQVRDLTHGEGVDVVIDTVGTPVFSATRRSLARGARWVMVGQLTGDFVPFNPAQLFLRGISLLSATSVTREELRRCLHLLADGTVRAMVDDTLPLEQAAQAHLRLEAGATLGRLTLSPGMAISV